MSMIKYKGNVGKLLAGIARALHMPVNLRISEIVVQSFFGNILIELCQEEKVSLVSILPSAIKQFCFCYTCNNLLPMGQEKKEEMDLAILLVLERNLQKEVFYQVNAFYSVSQTRKLAKIKKEKVAA